MSNKMNNKPNVINAMINSEAPWEEEITPHKHEPIDNLIVNVSAAAKTNIYHADELHTGDYRLTKRIDLSDIDELSSLEITVSGGFELKFSYEPKNLRTEVIEDLHLDIRYTSLSNSELPEGTLHNAMEEGVIDMDGLRFSNGVVSFSESKKKAIVEAFSAALETFQGWHEYIGAIFEVTRFHQLGGRTS